MIIAGDRSFDKTLSRTKKKTKKNDMSANQINVTFSDDRINEQIVTLEL